MLQRDQKLLNQTLNHNNNPNKKRSLFMYVMWIKVTNPGHFRGFLFTKSVWYENFASLSACYFKLNRFNFGCLCPILSLNIIQELSCF